MSANVPYAKTRQAMLDHAAGDTSAPLTPTMGRVLSAAQHIGALTHANGGASADLHSLKAYAPGDPFTMVGGTPDARSGKAFPTQQVDYGSQDPRATAGDIIDARKKMLPAAKGAKSPVLGTWTVSGAEHGGHVDIDLSQAFADRRQADSVTLARNEDANFFMGDMEEKSNEAIRAERGLGHRPPKRKGQNEVVRRA